MSSLWDPNKFPKLFDCSPPFFFSYFSSFFLVFFFCYSHFSSWLAVCVFLPPFLTLSFCLFFWQTISSNYGRHFGSACAAGAETETETEDWQRELANCCCCCCLEAGQAREVAFSLFPINVEEKQHKRLLMMMLCCSLPLVLPLIDSLSFSFCRAPWALALCIFW